MHDYKRTLRGNSTKAKRYHFSDLGLRPKLTLRPVMLSRHLSMGKTSGADPNFHYLQRALFLARAFSHCIIHSILVSLPSTEW